MKARPLVGLGVIIRKEGKVLFGKRKSAHGEGSWCCPGGHLEMWETFEACAKREVFEECDLEIKNIRPAPFTNDFFKTAGKHYVTIYFVADWKSGVPLVKEPDKMVEWGWFDWNDLPTPLFLSQENLMKTGFNPNFTRLR